MSGRNEGRDTRRVDRHVGALLVALTVLAFGCSSSGHSTGLTAGTAASTSTSTTAPVSLTVPGGSLVGTWSALETFVPVACAIGGSDANGTEPGDCPQKPARRGWADISSFTVTADGSTTVSFTDTEGKVTTTCKGQLSSTSAGLALTKLTCQGPDSVDTANYATPTKATLTDACLALPDDALFESHPGACGGSSGSTVTFAPIGG
jgi:hypothetical protein